MIPSDPLSAQRPQRSTAVRWIRRGIIGVALFVLYLASTIPIGLALYSLKAEAGYDFFKAGGFHTYMQCVETSFSKARVHE